MADDMTNRAKNTAESLHPLERKVLPLLKFGRAIEFHEIVSISGLKDVEVMRAIQWLDNKELIIIEESAVEKVKLGKNGLKYAKQGLPEVIFLKTLGESEMNFRELSKKSGLEQNEFNACLGVLKNTLAIEINNGKIKITDYGKKLSEEEPKEQTLLKKIQTEKPLFSSLTKEEIKIFQNFSKRQDIIFIEKETIRKISLTETGKKVSLIKSDSKLEDTLTSTMLKTGEWKNKKFRRYDVKSKVPSIHGGRRHFVNEAAKYAKKIWIEMGFKEMTGNKTQTNFWNLDSLFVPQDHPARSMQDTFYIKEPSKGTLPEKIWKKIKDVHENGGDTGSKGWEGKWKEELAKENVLRTHTTVLSAQTLSKIKKEDLPLKFFSVGKVFRNETIDWKHLFEFTQTEGIVIDPNANLKHLKGYLTEFFKKMGYPKIRIRPGHFPYTEPSCEVDVLHPEKKEWIELGGCGIFRPEVTKTLLGFECPVLAWGLGLERIILPYYEIKDLRELYKNDLKQLREIKAWMK